MAVLATFGFEKLLGPVLGGRFLLTPFLGAILIATWYGGLWPGLVALIGSFLVNYWLMPPLGHFKAYDQLHLFIAIAFTLTALLGLLLLEASRRRETRAGTALRESEERLGRILESAKDYAIFSLDRQGLIMTWSEGATRVFGRGGEEVLGRNVKILYSEEEEEAEMWRQDMAIAAKEGFAKRERWHRRKDGKRFFLNGMIWPMRDNTGRLLGYTKVARDTTERTLHQEELRQSERQAKAQYQGFPVPTYTWQRLPDGDFLLVDFNRSAEVFTHGHVAGVLGKKAQELFPDVPEIVDEIHRCAQEKRSSHREMLYQFRSFGESKHLAVTYVFVPPDMVMIHTEDITARKRHEEEIQQRTFKREAVAELGHRALVETDLQALFEKAAEIVSRALHAELSTIMSLCPDGKALLLRAGVGWKSGCVGQATVSADRNSQVGYTLASKRPVNEELVCYEPVIVEDIRSDSRFGPTQLLLDHNVVSGMCVVIHGSDRRPFGVLGVHTLKRRSFTEDDAQFLQSIANGLSGAIQRNSAEQALRESEQLARRRLLELESLYETAPVGLCQVDADFRFVRCNTRLVDFIGRPVEGLIGRTLREVLPGMARTMDPIYRKVIDSGAGLESVEVSGPSATNGKAQRDWLASFYPVQHGAAVLGISVVVQDITERKRMEAQLRNNEAVLARAQRIAHLGSWEIEFFHLPNLEDSEIHWSDEVYRILGYAPGEIPVEKGTFCKAVHPGDRPAIKSAIARVIQERQPALLEYSIIRPDGSQRKVRSQIEVVLGEDGRLKGLVGTVQDITDAKLIDEAIRESQRFLQSVLDATPSEIAILDETSDIIAVNQGWRRFGNANGFHAPNHGIGMNYLRACYAATREGSETAHLVAEALQEITSGKRKTFSLEYSCNGPEAKRWYMVRFRRFFTAGLVRIVCLHEDVTQLKLAQENLLDAKDQLSIYAKELENKVEERTIHLRESYRSLEGVLYHVAHDLRAPLRATEGLIRLLLQNYSAAFDAAGRDYGQRIAGAAKRMDELIRDLLEYGRVAQIEAPMTATELEPHINTVVSQLAEVVKAKSAKVEIDRPLPAVWAHPTLLDQVLRNLLDNALKFVRPGVTPEIHVWACEKNDKVEISLEDNCIDIGPQNQERIFRIFERLDQETGPPGTGIGLAIVSKAMERMNGSVGVQPLPGKGNRFWLELPSSRAN